MSAREEQPATVPPPAGEDDAYSAATKVGAMPAEVMAKLRAEGLLPEEDPEPPPVEARPPPPRPSVPRPMPSGRPSPAPSFDDEPAVDSNLPVLHSVPPMSAPTPSGLPRANPSDSPGPPPPPEYPNFIAPLAPAVPSMEGAPDLVVDMGTPPTFPETIETPVSFSAPASVSLTPGAASVPPNSAPLSSRPAQTLGATLDKRGDEGRSGRLGRLIAILLVLVAVFGVLFLMAFMRQRR